MSPELSVIVPIFNMAQTLDRTIKSILSQTYQDFELIVIDDGSTDNSEEVIHLIDDNKIKYFYQKHKNRCAAVNLGLEKIRGSFVAMVDADDYLPIHSLQERIDFLNNHNKYDVVYTQSSRIDSEGNTYRLVGEDKFSSEKQLALAFLTKLRGPFDLATLLYRRTVFDKVGGFDDTFPRAGDIEYFFRMIQQEIKVGSIQKPLYNVDMCYHSLNKRLVDRMNSTYGRIRVINTLVEREDKLRCYSGALYAGMLKFAFEIFSRKK